METIGSKYPFIFRNGYVHYKEFSISGLLSTMSDPNQKFYTDEELAIMNSSRISTPAAGANETRFSTDLAAENIYKERQFKLDVLEWLNNGEPKIFRSPTEGNYIVRLMNISLSPVDTLSRMLHSFQCTAYEIAEWNFKNLIDLHLIEIPVDKKSNLKV